MRTFFVLAAVAAVLTGTAGAAPPVAGTLATVGPVTLLAADGALAAGVVPGDGHSRCTRIVLWRPGSKPVTVKLQVGCGQGGPLEGVDDLALGGNRVLWEETNGGNNLELIVNTATVAKPKPVTVSYVENGNGAGGDPGGDYTGSLYADGPLLTFASWTQCDPYAAQGAAFGRACEKGKPAYYNGVLHRVAAGKNTVLRSGDDMLFPDWVDGGRVLVHNGTKLMILRTSGATLRTFEVGPDVEKAVFQGTRLAVLRTSSLDVYDTTTGVHTHSYPLVSVKRRLVDIQSGIAVLVVGRAVRLIQLDTGRGATFLPAGNGTVQAQLEPTGLFTSSAKGIDLRPDGAGPRQLPLGGRQVDRVAGPEHVDGDLRRDPRGRLGELPGRVVQERGAVAAVQRTERPPVDRHGGPRAEQAERLRRPLGVEVARADRRPPAPDREQREVEVADEAVHLREEVGIAGKEHP